MTQEIEDLRWQLQQRDTDVKKLQEVSSERQQLRRALTLETDTVDTKKQLSMVQQEADILQEKLGKLQVDNERLLRENRKFQLLAARPRNDELAQKVSALEKENSALLSRLGEGNAEDQQRILAETECENSRLITELSYYRKSRPDIGE